MHRAFKSQKEFYQNFILKILLKVCFDNFYNKNKNKKKKKKEKRSTFIFYFLSNILVFCLA
jgi:hypothetical protein